MVVAPITSVLQSRTRLIVRLDGSINVTNSAGLLLTEANEAGSFCVDNLSLLLGFESEDAANVLGLLLVRLCLLQSVPGCGCAASECPAVVLSVVWLFSCGPDNTGLTLFLIFTLVLLHARLDHDVNFTC